MRYEGFASVYDRLMRDVPYERFLSIFDDALLYTGIVPTKLIDLGCGTGALIPGLLDRTRFVTGVDPSEQMLAVAAERMAGASHRVSFLQASAADLRVPQQADGCVAFCDVLSYVLTMEELTASFAAVRRAVKPGGLFLFDLHSPHKITHHIGNNVYYDVTPDAVALMNTTVDPSSQTVVYDLTLFSRERKELYRRFDEEHRQRAYPLPDVVSALGRAGFAEVSVAGDLSFGWSDDRAVTLVTDRDMNDQAPSIHARVISGESVDTALRWFFLAR